MPPLLIMWKDVLMFVFVRDGFVEDNTLGSFFNKLNDTMLGDTSHDFASWDLDSKSDFRVKSYYLRLLH